MKSVNIYISYHSTLRDHAVAAKAFFETEFTPYVNLWLDLNLLEPITKHSSIEEQLQSAIAESDIFICLIPIGLDEDHYALKELDFAAQHKRHNKRPVIWILQFDKSYKFDWNIQNEPPLFLEKVMAGLDFHFALYDAPLNLEQLLEQLQDQANKQYNLPFSNVEADNNAEDGLEDLVSYSAFKAPKSANLYISTNLLRPYWEKRFKAPPELLRLWALLVDDRKLSISDTSFTTPAPAYEFILSKDTPGFYELDASGFNLSDKDQGYKIEVELDLQEGWEELDAKGEQIKPAPRYFIGGANWSGKDMLPEFLDQGSWAHGFEKPMNQVIEVAKGDILFVKTVARKNHELWIRAAGVVIENPEDGIGLKVDWNETIEQLEEGKVVKIPKLAGPYSTTFREVRDVDVPTIMQAVFGANTWITPEEPKKRTHKEEDSKPQQFKTTVTNDETVGNDQLGFDKDAKAFARLIALKETAPPLSIAIFGEWGSGKSFFMKLIERELKREHKLPKGSTISPHDLPYMEGIATITFNAWSYIDSNLWASLVTRIFEGLDEYLSKESKGDRELRQITEKLNQKLEIAHKEKKQIEEKVKELRSERFQLIQKMRRTLGKKRQLATEFRSLTKSSVLKKILNASEYENLRNQFTEAYRNTLPQVEDTRQEASRIETTGNAETGEPEVFASLQMIEDIKSFNGFWRSFLSNPRANLRAAGIALVVILISVIVDSCWINLSAFFNAALIAMAPILALAQRVQQTFLQMKPAIDKSLKLQALIKKALEEAHTKYEYEKQLLRDSIELHDNELAKWQEQLETQKLNIKDLKEQQSGGLARKAVAQLIKKRAEGGTYGKYLGVISTIRRDFETLSELLSFQRKNEKDKKPDGKSNRGKDIQVEKMNQADYLNNPLNRIVLFIDDLDRCPVEQVVEVLDAVKLLMCFDLFVVVVGVAPNWVRNSLIKKHHAQFGQITTNQDHEVVMVEPLKYLEKIFQIPYHLPAPIPLKQQEYVRSLFSSLKPSKKSEPPKPSTVEGNEASSMEVQKSAQKQDARAENEVEISYRASNMPSDAPVMDNQATDQPIDTKEEQHDNESISSLNAEAASNLSFYEMDEGELQLAVKMSTLVGTNPRTLKRYANLYRLVRVNSAIRKLNNKNEESQLKTLALLGILNGEFSSLCTCFNFSDEKKEEKLREQLIAAKADGQNEISNLINKFIWRAEKDDETKKTLDFTMKDYRPYYELLKQYSFEQPL